ncbi:MAG: Single-stranded DNA binding protein [Salinirussus sp.]
MSLDDRAEELASDLGADKEEVRSDLENLVSYDVPLDEAVSSLRRKYGDGASADEPEGKSIAEIGTADGNVSVTAVVLTAGKRSIRYQGEDQVIHEGELADGSGRIDFTAWVPFEYDPGDTLRIDGAGVREWEGAPELNIGESTTVTRTDASVEIDEELVGGDAELATLEPGDRGVGVEVRVLECERKIIDGRSGETEILSGVVGDESTRLPFTDWDPHGVITEDASVRIENVYVREFRGAPSVNVSEFSTVESLADPVAVVESAPRFTVREAVESGGLFDVELVGNVVGVRDGSGLIERCPECGRVTQNGQCRSHGAVDGQDDLRTKAILDDGTGTVTVILDEEITAEVYGGGLDAAREHARDAMDREAVADAIREELVGREFRVRGSLSVDEYGANLDAAEFAERDDDPSRRARTLLAEAGGTE